MRIAILAITEGAYRMARLLVEQNRNFTILDSEEKIAEKFARHWTDFDGFIAIMASGIVVRSIAPLLLAKEEDPAVIVMDERGFHVISLLSGHLGGANDLARELAWMTGGSAVITTASDVLCHTPLDLWARDNGLIVGSKPDLTTKSSLLVNRGHLTCCQDGFNFSLPHDFKAVDSPEHADIFISYKEKKGNANQLLLHPTGLVLGTGCRRDTSLEDYLQAFHELCAELEIHPKAIAKICSIEAKRMETGLVQFAEYLQLPIEFYSTEAINQWADRLSHSPKALEAIGAIGVAEPAALIGAGQSSPQHQYPHDNLQDTSHHNLYSYKKKWKNITMALASSMS